jgi:hypothetical protein
VRRTPKGVLFLEGEKVFLRRIEKMNKYGMLVVGGLLSLGAFAADEGVTLGGYVDAGYDWSHQRDRKDGTVNSVDQGGFLVREGGVYVGKKFGEWQVFSDVKYDGTNLQVSQAFLSTSMDNGLSWKIGKFDGLFGAYAGTVDPWTHRLTEKGMLQGYSPASHTGWTGSYSLSDMLKVSALVANDSDTAATAAQPNNGTRNPDLGLVVNADLDAVKADVGALFKTGNGAGSNSKLGYTLTANVHGKFSGFDLGVYGLLDKDDAEDANNDAAKSDFGVGVNVGYDLTSNLALNVRGEYLKTKSGNFVDAVGATFAPGVGNNAANSVMMATVGGQWKFSNSVVGKIDYSYQKVDANTDVEAAHLVKAGVVANF